MGLTEFLRKFYQQESHLPKEGLEQAIIESKDLELKLNRLQGEVVYLQQQKKLLDTEIMDLKSQIDETQENYVELSKLHLRELQKIIEANKLVEKWRSARARGNLGVLSNALVCADELEVVLK